MVLPKFTTESSLNQLVYQLPGQRQRMQGIISKFADNMEWLIYPRTVLLLSRTVLPFSRTLINLRIGQKET